MSIDPANEFLNGCCHQNYDDAEDDFYGTEMGMSLPIINNNDDMPLKCGFDFESPHRNSGNGIFYNNYHKHGERVLQGAASIKPKDKTMNKEDDINEEDVSKTETEEVNIIEMVPKSEEELQKEAEEKEKKRLALIEKAVKELAKEDLDYELEKSFYSFDYDDDSESIPVFFQDNNSKAISLAIEIPLEELNNKIFEIQNRK